MKKVTDFEKYIDNIIQKHVAVEYIVHTLDELKNLNTKFKVSSVQIEYTFQLISRFCLYDADLRGFSSGSED